MLILEVTDLKRSQIDNNHENYKNVPNELLTCVALGRDRKHCFHSNTVHLRRCTLKYQRRGACRPGHPQCTSEMMQSFIYTFLKVKLKTYYLGLQSKRRL